MFRSRPAFVVLFAVSAAVSGCGQVVTGAPQPDSAAHGTTVAGTPAPNITGAPVPLHSLAGQWTGTYLCGQGETALHLTIDQPTGNSARTLFAFGPLPANPSVPVGSFEMIAAYVGGKLAFTAGSWINRPDDYATVNLVADLISTSRLSGTVGAGGCTLFHADRDQH